MTIEIPYILGLVLVLSMISTFVALTVAIIVVIRKEW